MVKKMNGFLFHFLCKFASFVKSPIFSLQSILQSIVSDEIGSNLLLPKINGKKLGIVVLAKVNSFF